MNNETDQFKTRVAETERQRWAGYVAVANANANVAEPSTAPKPVQDSVTLTTADGESLMMSRQLIERAYAVLHPPVPVLTLDASNVRPGFGLHTSDGNSIYVGRRAVGELRDKGIYFGNLPTGYEWQLIREEGYSSARTLTIGRVGA